MGKRLVVVFMASCVVVASVGSIAIAAVRTVPKDVCKIVTEADVGEAFGLPATQGDSDAEKGKFSFCRWDIPIDLTYTDADGATVTLTGTGTFGVSCDKLAAITKKDFKSNSKASTAEKIPGLKKSFFDATESIVTFIKGQTFCNVQYSGTTLPDPDVVKDGLITLAKQVAKKA
jgi:hypothetical protein